MECPSAAEVFRLWIVRTDAWRARSASDVPSQAVAVEPVEDGLYSRDEAALFARTFNQVMLDCERPLWVVAVPVTWRLDGDAQSGMPISGVVLEQVAPEPSRGGNGRS